ncbi:hypothetical protein KEM52_006308 [Ascosphaera acerosa]|nr:hypothetical protein KEM52_006308 [Ascosphaera acerosa]
MPAATVTPRRNRQRDGPVPAPSATAALPPLEPQIAPLTERSQRLLLASAESSHLRALQAHFRNALNGLCTSGAIINETLAEAQARSRKRRRHDSDGQTDEAEDEALREQAAKTEQLTARLEEQVRQVIDEEFRMQTSLAALRKVAEVAPAGTAPDDGASVRYQSHIDKESGKRDRATMTTKYASNNDYKTWKRSIHDATYGYHDEAPPLAHPSTWFSDGRANGKRTRRNGAATAADDGDDDDDLAIQSEKISLTCPITLLLFTEPVTSKKCPHSFEKKAITDMIRQSPDSTTVQGARAKCTRCPVCQVLLTLDDLVDDPVIARKVARQKEREEREEDLDDDVEAGEEEEEAEEEEEEGDDGAADESELPLGTSNRQTSRVPDTQLHDAGQTDDDEDDE